LFLRDIPFLASLICILWKEKKKGIGLRNCSLMCQDHQLAEWLGVVINCIVGSGGARKKYSGGPLKIVIYKLNTKMKGLYLN
jgi:hypothetical protein